MSALAVLTALTATGVYLISCRIWPFHACRHCDATGHRRSPSHRAIKYCHHCRGTGLKLRTGRRILNALARLRHQDR